MYAHTAAIGDFGTANGRLGADIADVAAAISTVPLRAVAHALGPLGAQFAMALSDATLTLTRDLGSLADDLSRDATAVAGAARAYADAESFAPNRINLIGM